jgi:hypothetical protein
LARREGFALRSRSDRRRRLGEAETSNPLGRSAPTRRSLIARVSPSGSKPERTRKKSK